MDLKKASHSIDPGSAGFKLGTDASGATGAVCPWVVSELGDWAISTGGVGQLKECVADVVGWK